MLKKMAINSTLAVVVLLLAAGMAFAKAKEINISQPAKLANGPELQPGTYKVDLLKAQDAHEVLFYKGNEVVARTPAKVLEEPSKAPRTEIVYETRDGGRVITQMRVDGWREKLIFGEHGEQAKTGQ
jgi:hypothetical protein